MNLIVGAALITGVLAFLVTIFRDIGVTMLLNPDAIFIVIGGTLVALLIGFPFVRIRETVRDVIDTFTGGTDRETLIKETLEIARIYRKADIRGIERRMKATRDDFLRLGVNLIINHHRSDDIRNIMEREMAIKIVNHRCSQNMLKTAARLTPSFGLAGTVISLIKMFKHLQSVDTIAPLMAVALMSTFYGVVLSNLFMLPLSAKLKDRTTDSETLMYITIEGVVAMNNMEHPLRIEERMRGCSDAGGTTFQGAGTELSMTKSLSGA
ncbi:MAG TPA: MotA/TolQ/ExbB proton channel family protein [Thermodesulfovibrionales bacterium]|nr:MotA/TolQ/ExbB proton channel family protein [Thermodesulfovibrionales bacterium]